MQFEVKFQLLLEYDNGRGRAPVSELPQNPTALVEAASPALVPARQASRRLSKGRVRWQEAASSRKVRLESTAAKRVNDWNS